MQVDYGGVGTVEHSFIEDVPITIADNKVVPDGRFNSVLCMPHLTVSLYQLVDQCCLLPRVTRNRIFFLGLSSRSIRLGSLISISQKVPYVPLMSVAWSIAGFEFVLYDFVIAEAPYYDYTHLRCVDCIGQ